ncbi:MAG: OmpA family protein [Cohaesibacter sp.]|jgi:outer membrane protein OmpA-like peptidoglycan-associated protein|nr:OmpA family protein [Cohaesibacter sp.]
MKKRIFASWRSYAKLGAILLPVFAASDVSASGLISCADIEKEFQSLSSAPAMQLMDLYDKANDESDCDRAKVDAIGHAIAGRELGSIQSALAAPSPDFTQLESHISDLFYYSSHWKLSFFHGEIFRLTSRVGEAFKAYSAALAALDDPQVTPTEPDIEEIALLRRRLDEVSVIYQQLASHVDEVKLQTTRSGDPISIYSFSTRGYKVRKVPVPIKFDFDSHALSPIGKETLNQVFTLLKKQKFPSITVVGHTDPKGTDAYNMRLSMGRAEAVKAALEEKGYEGGISIKAKGEGDPFPFDDKGLYSHEQQMAAHRRVEFKLD